MEVLFVVVFSLLTALCIAAVAWKARQFAVRISKLKEQKILVGKEIADAKEARK